MTIGQAMPAVPGLGEKTAAPGAEGAAPVDMFGGIIAGMAAALGEEAVEGESTATPEVPAEAQADPGKAAEAVVQLLALTARQQGKARGETESDTAEDQAPAECELEVPTLGEDGGDALPLATIAPPPAQQPTVTVAKDVAEAPLGNQPVPVMPADIGRRQAELAKVVIAQLDTDKSAPKTVAAAQISDLSKAVTKPITLANARIPAADPSAAKDDTALAAIDSRGHVQAAIAPSIPLGLAPLEAARPLDALLEPIAVEPQIDPSEFAIERQLDVSAEGEWLDSLAKDIARTAGEGGTLRFRLNPENLGTLRVEITPQANGQAVRLTADTDAARAIIAEAQPRLIAEAKANGVRISETHVDLGQQNASGGDPRRQNTLFEEAPIRTARFLREQEESDGKPTRNHSERYA